LSEAEDRSRAGFTLLEVLVALAVAGLFLSVLARGFATAWGRQHIPVESIWAIALAREVAADVRDKGVAISGSAGGFNYTSRIEPLTIEPKTSSLPPTPPQDHRASQRFPLQARLQQITVRVIAPSGHRFNYQTIRLALRHP
jgi:prepilin-type N-terminal cleavage/methylation domain-containing protein